MIPVGYIAKRVCQRPACMEAPQVGDIFSLSGCVSENFTDCTPYWKHNGFWFFDSPEIIQNVAHDNSLSLEGTSVFYYYEAHATEFDGETWQTYAPEASSPTDVVPPFSKLPEGFDVVPSSCRTSAECSPLSCNGLAKDLQSNAHGLFASFEEAETSVASGAFEESEPGPYRIFAVYSVDWPLTVAGDRK